MKNKLILLYISIISILVIQPTHAQIIHRVAGTVGVGGYSGVGGPATVAVIQNPQSVALDTFGNLYIADGDNDVIQKVDTAGIITTIAGNGGRGYSGDGGPATNATLNSPTGLSLDLAGNIYFADNGNNIVRVINAVGIINTIAGNRIAGYTGDGGPATNAKLNWPCSTAIDKTGNLFISDQNNDMIRKVNDSGIISTFAGNGVHSYNGDGGPATDAELLGPYGIAVDVTGNLFIADSWNNVIREVDTSGIITTIAGCGIGGFAGDGGAATASQLNLPVSIGINNNQGMYIADYGNSVIRKINTSGIISTVAGDGINGYSGDGGMAIYARLNHPGGMAVDKYGNFYFGDVYDYVVRKIDTSHVLAGIISVFKSDSLSVFPDPATTELTIVSHDAITALEIIDDIGRTIYSFTRAGVLQLHINVADFPSGVYLIKVNGIQISKFIKQ
jgi:hypothetical protein